MTFAMAAMLVVPIAIHAEGATGDVTEFALPLPFSQPTDIVNGPDNNLWFTEVNDSSIGRISPNGQVTEFRVAPSGVQVAPYNIAVGSDGNLWFTENNGRKIGRITTTGQVTEFPTSDMPIDITAGPDGNLWFTEFATGMIGRITTAGQVTKYPTNLAVPNHITGGPDGNIWFTAYGSIGRITPSGQVTGFRLPMLGNVPSITTGPDGNLWFTEFEANKIGSITPSGQITEYSSPTPSSSLNDIATGPDGNIWFAERAGKVGSITPNGHISEYLVPTADSQPWGITTGPDGNIWFTEYASGKIGRMEVRPIIPSVLTLTTAVTSYPIEPDPGLNAYVRFKITAKNGDGTPASNATVKLSNSLPTAPPLHTNEFGVLTLLEPVNVTAANAGSPVNITATVTSTSGATAAATQELFEADPQVTCSFLGQPQEDLSLLKAMLPEPLGTIQELAEFLGTTLGGLHTNAVGYIVTVPGSRNFYAQSVVITRRDGSTAYSGVGYSYQQILKPPTSPFEGLKTGCGGPKA